MKPQIDLSEVAAATWQEYVIRFLFGGFVTVTAGLLAKHFGPVFGGLFMAFPAIFPASATMLYQAEKKRHPGASGEEKARLAVRADAAGAATGCIALGFFAAMVWQFLPKTTVWWTLAPATACWFSVSAICWVFFRKIFGKIAESENLSR